MKPPDTTPPIPGGLIAELKLLPRPFYLLMLGTFISRFGHFVVPFLAIYLRQLGYPPSVTGYALGAYGAGGFVASILGGYLADKIGRKPTLLISCFGATVAMLLLSVAHTIPTLIGGTFLAGLMTCIYYPASSSLIADIIPKPLRIRAYAVQRLAINLAFALGMTTAGLVAKSSFIWLFIADASTTAVLGVIILFGLKRGIGKKTEDQSAGWGAALSSISQNKPFVHAAIAGFIAAVIFWQTSSTLGLQVVDVSGFDERTFGFLLGLNGVMIVLFEIPLTNWTRKHDAQLMIGIGYGLVGLGLALIAFSGSMTMLVIAIVVLTIGEMISLPVNSSYVAALAPDDMRGRYMGIMGLSWNIAIGAGPMLGLWVFGYSPELLWALCGVAGLASTWIIMIGRSQSSSSLKPSLTSNQKTS